LAQVLEPSLEAAARGLTVTWELLCRIASRLSELESFRWTAEFLLPGGRLPALESTLDLSDLHRTLSAVARRGAAGFYTGPVAQAIERELGEHGGVLSARDLVEYEPKLLTEAPRSYRGTEYVTGNDQVSYEALNILDCFELSALDPEGADYRHLLAEALACAYVDNMTHYGDPDHARSPIEALASPEFARARAAGLRLDTALPRPVHAADPWPYQTGAEAPTGGLAKLSAGGAAGTSQVVTADRGGSMAALCTSVSASFGSCVLVPGTGVFLNNGMGNFDPRPDRANAIAPGKMPIFAAPALVATRGSSAVFASSGSGGYRITSGVLHTLSGVIDFGRQPQAAVDAPRVHCQGGQTSVDDRIPAAVRDELSARGHDVVVQSAQPGATHPFGRICAITVDEDGTYQSGSNPAATTAAAAP
jgi:gamma-glutamyltranspeptidase/glutathione hydrolase